MNNIIISDQRIIAYFKQHPNLNAVKLINMFIDLLENINTDLKANLSTQMIANLSEQIKVLDNKVGTINNQNQAINNMLTILQNQKDSIVSDFSLLLKNSEHDNTKTISSIIKDNQDSFISKTKDNLLTITNPDLREKINMDFNKFFTELKKEKLDLNTCEKMMNDKIRFLIKHVNDKFIKIDSYVEKQTTECVTNIGKNSENKLEPLLNQCFPDAEIENTSGQTGQGDFIIHRNAKNSSVCPKVMVENKCYSKNVPAHEVEKFIRDIENLKCHGVFFSQNS